MQNGPPSIVTVQHYSYNPKDIIGRGYSSTVYKGLDNRNSEAVAIKVVDMKLLEDELHQQLLKDEIKALEMLKDTQNVVKLLSISSNANQTCIVTEFCEGKDLAMLIRSKRTMSDQNIMGIVRQLVTGYLSLWKNGIVHRDLKPANILIKEGTIKLADFGFVSWNSSCSDPFTYNVGSPSYMAPEALRRNVYSYKSDIWALGVIAFELTFGKVPWRNSNDLFLYQMLMNQPILALIEKQRPITPALMEFILRCCTPNVEERLTPEELAKFDWETKTTTRPPAKSETESTQQRRGLHQYMKQTRNKSQLTEASTTAPILFQSVRSYATSLLPAQGLNSGSLAQKSSSALTEKKTVLGETTNWPTAPINIPTCTNLLQQAHSPAPSRAPSHYIPTSPHACFNPLTASTFMQSSALFKSTQLSPYPNSPTQHHPLLQMQARATSPPLSQYAFRASSPPARVKSPFAMRPFEELDQLNENSEHAEECIMSQVQYCRFLNILLKELTNQHKIQRCLKSQLLKKIGLLNQMAVHQTNVFQLRGFYWLTASSKWTELKTLIQKYYQKYNGDYQQSRIVIFDESILIQNIKQLVNGTGSETVLLQKLVTFLQLKQLEKKLDYNEFSNQSKIDLLVDRQPFTDSQRLKSRMQVLGLC